MSRAQALEGALLAGMRSGLRALPRRAARDVGASLGGLARRLGIRRHVARANLALAFPDLDPRAREAILAEHYRELGRVIAEFAHGHRSVFTDGTEVIAAARGLEHLESARRAGRGAVLLSGHYGNFGLLAGWLGRRNPVEIAGKPLGNPHAERMIVEIAAEGGMERIRFDRGARRVFAALRENHWVALLADQDAGADGAFVPFFGRPASTWLGPASISLRTGAPLVMAFIRRREDGRNEVDVLPPLAAPDPRAPDAAHALTALHTATLEQWVRRDPAMWFWLHRRWKSTPPVASVAAGAGAESEPVRRVGAV